MFRRRRIPPENCLTGSLARSARPVCSSAQSTCFERSAPRQPVEAPNDLQVLSRGQQRIHRDFLWHDPELGRSLPAIADSIEHANLAAVEPHAPGDRADQRRLAGPVRAEQCEQFSLPQFEGRPVERGDVPELFPRVRDSEDVHTCISLLNHRAHIAAFPSCLPRVS